MENCMEMDDLDTYNRKRGTNYTPQEKQTLMNLIDKYADVVQSKDNRAANIIKKKKTWYLITQEYNKVATTGVRTCNQLKTLYVNKKRNRQRMIALEMDDESQVPTSPGSLSQPLKSSGAVESLQEEETIQGLSDSKENMIAIVYKRLHDKLLKMEVLKKGLPVSMVHISEETCVNSVAKCLGLSNDIVYKVMERRKKEDVYSRKLARQFKSDIDSDEDEECLLEVLNKNNASYPPSSADKDEGLDMSEACETVISEPEMPAFDEKPPGFNMPSPETPQEDDGVFQNGTTQKSSSYKDTYYQIKIENAKLERRFMMEKHILEMDLLRMKVQLFRDGNV